MAGARGVARVPLDSPRAERRARRGSGAALAAGLTRAPKPRAHRQRPVRAAQFWGLGGVALIFADAIVQLGTRGVAVLRAGLEPVEWVAFVALTAAFLYGEGVRALQCRWVPHMLDRVAALGRERALVPQLLAPLYALTLIAAPARELVRAWAGAFAIVLAVLIVRALPEPWRGIIDFAVATALTWALGAMFVQACRRLRAAAG